MIICWIFSCYWTGTCWSGIRLPWRETEVTCKTNSSYIEWNVTSPPYKWSWTQFLSLNTVVSPIFMNQYFWTSQMSGEKHDLFSGLHDSFWQRNNLHQWNYNKLHRILLHRLRCMDCKHIDNYAPYPWIRSSKLQ